MKFFKELFSSQGTISSKRVVGTAIILISMGCIVYLTVKEGAHMIVDDLLTTALILGAALLGVSNITSIWKGNIWRNGFSSDCEKNEKNNKRKMGDPGD